MSVWFEGSGEIKCSIEDVKKAVSDHGVHYVGVVSLMPGLASMDLVEQGSDSVIVKTSEGLMVRSNISVTTEDDLVFVECDEVSQAGSKVTATSHFMDEFTTSGDGVIHRVVISDVSAPGMLGSMYRKFGSSRMGAAFLASYKTFLEGED